jgi:hypothetical protein
MISAVAKGEFQLYESRVNPVSQPGILLADTSLKDQRKSQNITDRPDVVGETGGHRWCALPVAALQSGDALSQGLVGSGQMIIASPPMHMEQQAVL